MLTSNDSLFGSLLVFPLFESFHNFKIGVKDSMGEKISTLVEIVDGVIFVK